MGAATAVAPAAFSAAPAYKPVNKWLVTVSVSFGTLMGTIDASIVNVALSHIRGTIGATLEEITWVATGFAIATVLVMPLTAFLGRLFGQKRVYLISLGLFLVGSALCGLARSLPALVLFRAIQGFGAGALQPTEQAILRQTFPPKEQGMAMALFALAIMIGPAIGPTLGGYIVDNWSWPWIFYINLPVGALGLFMVTSFVHEPPDIREANKAMAVEQRKNMDWWGVALLSMGLVALQYLLEEGNRLDWLQSKVIVGCALLSFVTLSAFIIRELSARMPAVNLTLFKDTVFLSGTVIGAVMFAMLMSVTFLLPMFMQELLGFDATQSGLQLMPRTLVMMVLIPIVGRLYNKIDPRISVLIGMVTYCLSAFLLSRINLDTTGRGLVNVLIIQGIGFSFMMVPLNTVALSSIPRHKLTDATGLNSLFRQIGGSVGLAICVTFLSRIATQAASAISAHVTDVSGISQARVGMIQAGMMARGLDPSTSHAVAIGALKGMVYRQAMVQAFDQVFFFAFIGFLVLFPLVYFLKSAPLDPDHKPEMHVEI